MSKFQVGQRVLFYDHLRRVGIIREIDQDGRYTIESPSGETKDYPFRWIHEKQIRRLKKREPLRTWWITDQGQIAVNFAYTSKAVAETVSEKNNDIKEIIEVREVRKKK